MCDLIYFLSSQIGTAVALYVFKGDARQTITDKMKDGMNNYAMGEEFKGVTDTWDAIQVRLGT